jgi:hypothetical protein
MHRCKLLDRGSFRNPVLNSCLTSKRGIEKRDDQGFFDRDGAVHRTTAGTAPEYPDDFALSRRRSFFARLVVSNQKSVQCRLADSDALGGKRVTKFEQGAIPVFAKPGNDPIGIRLTRVERYP